MRRPARPRSLLTPGAPMSAPRSMGALLDLQAERAPDRAALTFEGKTLTRAELAARVNRRARALAKLGVVAGDFVSIALPNGPAFLELAFAAWALGATPAPLAHTLPMVERQAILDLLSPRLVVSETAAPCGVHRVVAAVETYDEREDATPLPEHTAPHLKATPAAAVRGVPR